MGEIGARGVDLAGGKGMAAPAHGIVREFEGPGGFVVQDIQEQCLRRAVPGKGSGSEDIQKTVHRP